MNKGVLLFAFNTDKVNYYEMAVATAKRANHFLNLPVTLVTDKKSVPDTPSYSFDKVIIADVQEGNMKDKEPWYNKGRYRAYDYSPYDETILLDTDYMINSNRLLKIFDFYDDFCCHDTTSFILNLDMEQEYISSHSFKTLWATVIVFKKTSRTKQIFECLEMVQNNYEHYANIHRFVNMMYRNDFGLTLALRIVNGHIDNKRDIIPWSLIHSGRDTTLYKNTETEFNTEYTALYDGIKHGRSSKDYITIKDCDFHVMDKFNFMDII